MRITLKNQVGLNYKGTIYLTLITFFIYIQTQFSYFTGMVPVLLYWYDTLWNQWLI